MTDELNIFKSISSFVKDLAEMYGKKSHPLRLYERLLSKTRVSNTNAIEKHISIFKTFYEKNKEHILARESDKLQDKIEYSQSIFIEIKSLMQNADRENKEAIWKHLLYIVSLLDPVSNAKDMLKTMLETSEKKDGNVINEIIDEIGKNIDTSASSNPMDIINNLMTSGVFAKLVTKVGTEMADGNLNLGSLMGVISNLSGGQGPNMANMMSMAATLSQTLPQQPTLPQPTLPQLDEHK